MNDIHSGPREPSHAVAKGFALGLGVLLIAGTILLVALLVLREGEPQVRDIPKVELGSGERIASVSADGGVLVILIETETGDQRLLVLDRTTGRRAEVEVHTP